MDPEWVDVFPIEKWGYSFTSYMIVYQGVNVNVRARNGLFFLLGRSFLLGDV